MPCCLKQPCSALVAHRLTWVGTWWVPVPVSLKFLAGAAPILCASLPKVLLFSSSRLLYQGPSQALCVLVWGAGAASVCEWCPGSVCFPGSLRGCASPESAAPCCTFCAPAKQGRLSQGAFSHIGLRAACTVCDHVTQGWVQGAVGVLLSVTVS
jgi:hypothetical protein